MFPETSNKLDAIVLNLCLKEIGTPRFERFLQYIMAEPWIPGIKFVIVCNGILKQKDEWVVNLQKHVGETLFHDLNLDPMDDLYDKHRKLQNKKVKIPPLGFFSGPNMMFFRSLAFSEAQDFNTIFLLETDVHLAKGWLAALKNYCENNFFLIAGSNPSHPTDRHLNDHLNGVALYKTNSKNLSEFIELVKKFTLETCKTNPWFPYDYALWQTFRSLATKPNYGWLYRFLFKHMHGCHLMLNLVSEPNPSYEYCKTYFPGSLIFHIDNDKFVIESEQ